MNDHLIVQVRPMVQEYYATGGTRVLQEQILADFHVELVRPHERQLALEQFHFRGLYQERDEVTTVPPDYRIGLFDTEAAQADRGWSDETREEVEAFLSRIADRHEHILIAPRASVPPPWPRYDEYPGTIQKLGQKLLAEGHDLQQTLTYERETQNRPRVVEEIQRLIENPDGQVDLEPETEVVLG